ncbi:MAG TPA: S1/P1 nuclease [Terriglobia bacterium]|nr:S1/P1 nuclease [Terriglobia bacterium]
MRPKSHWFIRRALLVACALVLASTSTLAWGPEGHRDIGAIVEKNLKPETLAAIKAMFGPYDTLAAVSVWADDIRDEHPETGPWHYIDIPLIASSIDMNRDCRNGDCVIAKIHEFEAVLKNKSADPTARRDALKFLVHFVGDLHQPLHCEDNGDKGGNTVQVIFFGQPMNLHAVWDGGILRREKVYGLKLASDLNGRITPAEKTAWARGSIEDWAMEGHALAVQVAYGRLPHEATPNLGDDYFNAALPVVELQIEKAGVRLASILNRTLP